MPVSFYQRRWDVLEQFDRDDLLQSHRVIDERIALRLGDAYHLISFGDGYFDAALLTPEADADRLREALAILFDTLQPKALLRPIFDFQWLSALDRPYDEVRSASASAVFGDAGATVVDWSANVDGRLEAPPGTYRAEFGIVSSSEAGPRLARSISPFISSPAPDIPPSIWPRATFPEVAWFFDSRVALSDRVEEPSIDALFDLWSRVGTPLSQVQSSFRRSFQMEEHEQRSP